jgi:hypothetical protein
MRRKVAFSPPSSISSVRGHLWRFWTIIGPLVGFILGAFISEGGNVGLLLSQYDIGSGRYLKTDGLLTRPASTMPEVPTKTQDGLVHMPHFAHDTGRVGFDLLPHLKDCDKPQSTRTLQEMASVYQPTKFYGYLHANYDRFYPQYMDKYRTKYFRMLEIGLETGKGALLWKEYFPCVTLVGLEQDVSNTRNEGASRIQTIVGDQGNTTFLRTEFLRQTNGGNFDLIVDDGGHHYEQQRASYEALFEVALNPGGLYIIEDIETSYWQPGKDLYHRRISRGGMKEPSNIINQFKEVVHVINKKFHDNTFTVFGQVDQLIATICFGSNVIIMEKKTMEHCWNERPYMWPQQLNDGSPAKEQPEDANAGSLIHKFCEGIDIFLRDAIGQMRNGGVQQQ